MQSEFALIFCKRIDDSYRRCVKSAKANHVIITIQGSKIYELEIDRSPNNLARRLISFLFKISLSLFVIIIAVIILSNRV